MAGPLATGMARTVNPASARMASPAMWMRAGPPMASGQALNPARVRPRLAIAARKPPSGATKASMIAAAMIGVSMVSGRLASPMIGTASRTAMASASVMA